MKILILGGGQLARMLALSAHPLNVKTVCIDPSKDACGGDVTQLIVSELDQIDALLPQLEDVDAVTIETENIPVETARAFSRIKPFFPSIEALAITQDRMKEKTFVSSLQIPTARFASATTLDELQHACEQLELPVVVKTCRFGYDGKGQAVIRDANEIETVWRQLASDHLIVEAFVNFTRELSLISVRDKTGNMVFYPLVENLHQEGILRSSTAPYQDAKLQQLAQDHASKIMQELNYVGVMTIEFFQVGDHLLINEIAPRVHNSGHWTIEGAHTSQFANHIRAIAGIPLGSTETTGFSYMHNCIGEMPLMNGCMQIPGMHYHAYNKAPRNNRKVGHITIVANDSKTLQSRKAELLKKI